MSLPSKYNQQFIDHFKATQQGFTDAAAYGVTVNTVADPTLPHWRVIGIHHLTGPENHGQHHLFCDVLDEFGQRINGATLSAQNNDLPPATLTIDKPLHEPGTNTQMYWNDNLSISVHLEGLPSETATGFHTRHPDEEPGTTRGHHSFYVVFQKVGGVTDQPPPSQEVVTPADQTDSLEQLLWGTGDPLVQRFNREAALYRQAQERGLGEHLTVEYEVFHRGQVYVAQIFELGLVYAPMEKWDQVAVLEAGTREVDLPFPPELWEHHITGFYGSRWNYWENYLQGNIPGLTWTLFKEEVINLNPHIAEDDGAILPQKVYCMPQRPDQPAAPENHPEHTPALPPKQPPNSPTSSMVSPPPPKFVQVHHKKFYINGHPQRFIGVNIRGLIHYGQDPDYFQLAPIEHRAIQLQSAKEMNARLVRVFLAHNDATPVEIECRLRDTLDLMKAQYPEMYLLPALTNLYKDVPFYVQGDEKFYDKEQGTDKEILNHAFYGGGYTENYLPFVEHIVSQFKDEPQIFAWEIGNELKAENNPQLLVNFMTTMAAKIKALDPNHLVTTGMISTRHAFMTNPQDPLRDELYGSPNIDFITIHPYNGNRLIPCEVGNPTIGIEDDMDLADKHYKPLIVEEAGFDNRHYNQRADKTRQDMAYWFGRGASCYMPWGFVATPSDNNDGDEFIGMTGPCHTDFSELYALHRKCGEILRNRDMDQDVSPSILRIDFHAREIERDLLWPLIVDGFDFPLGKPHGEGYYVAADLVDPSYYDRFDFWHTGEDWNGVGGGDSDLGDPVYAIAHGLVITAQSFPKWGNIVLLEHVLPTGDKVWSQYAHLDELFVEKGDILPRGTAIGTIGKGGNHRFVAHLHFEIRLRKLPASKWGWKTRDDREKVLRYYAHPTNFIKSYRPR